MQNYTLKFSLFLAFLFSVPNLYSQEEATKDTIIKRIENYFTLDRENIHIQLNKKNYFTNEEIAFKGYIYDAKRTLPFASTTNIYANLYNEKKEKINDKLFYVSNGSFIGSFKLDESLPTGNYYIHIFTNWMNNFKEDESSTYEIKIININDSSFLKEVPDYSKTSVTFYPEGGAIVENIKNGIGIKISDCNGNPIPVSEGELLNSQGKVLQKIFINKFGHGKFDLLAENITYKVRFLINGETIEKLLPPSVSEGISIDANSYSLKNKTVVKIKANLKTIEKYKAKPLFVIVNQYSNVAVFSVDFKNNLPEQLLFFDNENLSIGVNTLRIVDENLNLLAERLLFKYPEEYLKLNLEPFKKENDSINFTGTFNFPNTEVSISVLPDESLSSAEDNDIFASFLLKPFLAENLLSAKYYFEEITSKKKYELDLLLLNQEKNKYQWKDIVASPPKATFDFDSGLALKGTLNQTVNKGKSQVLLVSESGAQFGAIDGKNEFYFNNLFLADSTKVNFRLTDDKGKTSQFKGYPQVLNSRRIFNKPFFIKQICEPKTQAIPFSKPVINQKTISLAEVEIIKNAPPKLKHANILGNGRLRGYKITESQSNGTLFQFIGMNGFDVEYHDGHYDIYSKRGHNLGRGRGIPAIFTDGSQIMDNEMLRTFTMRDVDEIYIDRGAISSANGSSFVGIIKIYLKMPSERVSFKSNSMSFSIPKGFSVIKPFKNLDYASTSDEGFSKFGIIDWIPTITSETNNLTFKIPNKNQKKIKLLIEGFTGDGKLISEIKTIDLQ